MKKNYISAEKLDEKFDLGEDIVEYLDLSKAKRPGLKPRRVSIDFPEWMVVELDHEAARLGIPRQSVIKVWISERLRPA
jgi:hypothetical protein